MARRGYGTCGARSKDLEWSARYLPFEHARECNLFKPASAHDVDKRRAYVAAQDKARDSMIARLIEREARGVQPA